MSTFVGRAEGPAMQSPAAPIAPEPVETAPTSVGQKADKTRAELVEEAESLGVKVPPKATKAQIQKLIDEAPVM